MTSVLGFEPSDDVHSTFKALHDIVFAKGKNYTLTEANKIFSDDGNITIFSIIVTRVNYIYSRKRPKLQSLAFFHILFNRLNIRNYK